MQAIRASALERNSSRSQARSRLPSPPTRVLSRTTSHRRNLSALLGDFEELRVRPAGQRPLPPLPRARSVPATYGTGHKSVVVDEVENEEMASNNNAFPASEMNANNRNAVSPTNPHQANGTNINSAAYMTPLPVGHQQDLNFLFSQIQELSSLLASNREKVGEITRNAEEVAVSFMASSARGSC